MKRTFLVLVLASLLLSFVTTGGSAHPDQGDVQPGFPIRAAFVYPWFPEAWEQHDIWPYTNFNPEAGWYSSSAPATIRAQIDAMQYGGIEAGILSWWGKGSNTDKKIPTILANTAGSTFRWSLYYEEESTGNPSSSQIASDLSYIQTKYGTNPSFLRINGRFVIFVYTDGTDGCDMAARWSQGNTVNAYIVLKVFKDFKKCAHQPASWHQYGPATAAIDHSPYSYSISPGFWQKGQAVRLGRDLTRWYADIRNMVASGAKFQLITTFNEWGEGTAVESATEWMTTSGYGAYLDALHMNGVPGPLSTFTDVPHGFWAYDFIQSVYDSNISSGCNIYPPKYCPNTAVTRAQMAVFLLRAKHGSSYSPPGVEGETGFSDVSSGYWAAAWIKALAAEGITGGCGGDSYCPDQPVTRDQMAVFLLRTKYGDSYTPPNATGSLFDDVSGDHWAADWIEQLAVEGITSGCDIGYYCPSTPVSRAAMSVFLVKAFNLP